MNIKEDTKILPLPTESLIHKKEEDWKIKLPDDYKEFIKNNNGGIPLYRNFHCRDNEYLLSRFLCILENASNHPLGWYDIDVVESQIGERLTNDLELIGIDLLPIAEIFGGNYLCLDFRKDTINFGVYLWFHELSGEFEPYVEFVANDFTEFLEMLHE